MGYREARSRVPGATGFEATPAVSPPARTWRAMEKEAQSRAQNDATEIASRTFMGVSKNIKAERFVRDVVDPAGISRLGGRGVETWFTPTKSDVFA